MGRKVQSQQRQKTMGDFWLVVVRTSQARTRAVQGKCYTTSNVEESFRFWRGSIGCEVLKTLLFSREYRALPALL